MSEGVNSTSIRLVLTIVMCLCVEAANELKGQRGGEAPLRVHLLLRESMRTLYTTVLHFAAPLLLFFLLLLLPMHM